MTILLNQLEANIETQIFKIIIFFSHLNSYCSLANTFQFISIRSDLQCDSHYFPAWMMKVDFPYTNKLLY